MPGPIHMPNTYGQYAEQQRLQMAPYVNYALQRQLNEQRYQQDMEKYDKQVSLASEETKKKYLYKLLELDAKKETNLEVEGVKQKNKAALAKPDKYVMPDGNIIPVKPWEKPPQGAIPWSTPQKPTQPKDFTFDILPNGEIVSRRKNEQPQPGARDAGQTTQGGWETFSPEQKQVWYEQYRTSGKLPTFGWGDKKSRADFSKDFADFAVKNNLTGADVGNTQATYKALSSSLSQQQKNRGMMGSFVSNLVQQVDRVEEVERDLVNRVGIRAIDLPRRELVTKFKGSGAEKVLEAYLVEISNEIGKLSTGSAASIRELSIEAQKRWDKIHDPNLSIKELKLILDETKKMAQMRLSSTDQELETTKEAMSNIGKKTPKQEEPKADVGIPKEAASQLKEGVIITFGNGQRWTLKNGTPSQVQ